MVQPAITAYRVGALYCFDRPDDRDAEAVTLTLSAGVWAKESESGELLIYSFTHDYGVRINSALALGMCQVVELDEDEDEMDPVYRADSYRR